MITEEKRVLRHESTVRRALWPPLITMAVLTVLLLGLVYQLYETDQSLENSNRIILRVSKAMRLSIDMENGKRGYLLAGNRALLQPYDDAGKIIDEAYGNLLTDVKDSPGQYRHASAMYKNFKEWRAEAESQIAGTKYNPSAILERKFDDTPGKAKMDQVRKEFNAFLDRERELRLQRLKDSQNAMVIAFSGGGSLLILTGSLLAFMTRRQLQELSVQYETALEAESRVRERLSTTLISIGDGVLVTDRNGIVTLLNPVAEQLTGWTQQEAHGKPSKLVFDIAHEKTGETVRSPIEQAIQENRSVLLANHTVLKQRDGTVIAIEDSASPVRNKKGEVTGVVLVFRDVTERKRKEAELAAALEKNARIAETLQRSMLIKPPAGSFDGMTLSTLYEPARDEAQVGGDFYDAFSFRHNKVALVIGDATGKGLSAAATTSEVKYALRAFLFESDQPAQVLGRLNRFLASTQRVRMDDDDDWAPFSFISMALVVIDTQTGEGRGAVAGAEPPLHVRSDGSAMEVGQTGMMLGASTDSEYQEATFKLAKDDMLVFTTDGITEARRGKREFFGYEGFARAVQNARQQSPESLDTIAASVVAEAKTYSGGRLKDDVCLLLAKRS